MHIYKVITFLSWKNIPADLASERAKVAAWISALLLVCLPLTGSEAFLDNRINMH